MAASESSGPELLRREILQEARRQEEEILRRAQETAARVRAKAEQETEQLRKEKLDGARADAKRRREAILATVSVETNRMRLARIEKLLQEIRDGACQRIANEDGFSRRDALAGLSARALGSMAGERFVMRLSGADLQELGDPLRNEVQRRRTGARGDLRLEADPEARKGSCVLLDEEMRQRWDVGLPARLERLWPELRRQIATQLGFVEKPESKAGEV